MPEWYDSPPKRKRVRTKAAKAAAKAAKTKAKAKPAMSKQLESKIAEWEDLIGLPDMAPTVADDLIRVVRFEDLDLPEWTSLDEDVVLAELESVGDP